MLCIPFVISLAICLSCNCSYQLQFILQKENEYPTIAKGMSPSPMRRGLQPHDANRANTIQQQTSHTMKVLLEPVPATKPLKKSAVTFNIQEKTPDNSNQDQKALSPAIGRESDSYSPQTPGLVSRKNLAGHTPFKGDGNSMSESVKQDSFMQKKFGHDYGIHRNYDHDYSILNKTSSSFTSSNGTIDANSPFTVDSNSTMSDRSPVFSDFLHEDSTPVQENFSRQNAYPGGAAIDSKDDSSKLAHEFGNSQPIGRETDRSNMPQTEEHQTINKRTSTVRFQINEFELFDSSPVFDPHAHRTPQRDSSHMYAGRTPHPMNESAESDSQSVKSPDQNVLQNLLDFPSETPQMAKVSHRDIAGTGFSSVLSDMRLMQQDNTPISTISPQNSIITSDDNASNGLTFSFLCKGDAALSRDASQASSRSTSASSSPLLNEDDANDQSMIQKSNLSFSFQDTSGNMNKSDLSNTMGHTTNSSSHVDSLVSRSTANILAKDNHIRSASQAMDEAMRDGEIIAKPDIISFPLSSRKENTVHADKNRDYGDNDRVDSLFGVSPGLRTDPATQTLFHLSPSTDASGGSSQGSPSEATSQTQSAMKSHHHASDLKIMEFDADFIRRLKELYHEGKISKDYYLVMFDELYSRNNHAIETNDKPTDDLTTSSLANNHRRSISAPRSMHPSTPDSTYRPKDDSVDVNSIDYLRNKKKEYIEATMISPNHSENLLNVTSATTNHHESDISRGSATLTSFASSNHFNVSDSHDQGQALPYRPTMPYTEESGYIADGISSSIDSSFDTTSMLQETQQVRANHESSGIHQAKYVPKIVQELKKDLPIQVTVEDRYKPSRVSDMVHNESMRAGISLRRPILKGCETRASPKPSRHHILTTSEPMKEMDISNASLPYLGVNEPSFARRLGKSSNNHDPLDRNASPETSIDSHPNSMVLKNEKSLRDDTAASPTKAKHMNVDVALSPFVLDKSIQCSSMSEAMISTASSDSQVIKSKTVDVATSPFPDTQVRVDMSVQCPSLVDFDPKFESPEDSNKGSFRFSRVSSISPNKYKKNLEEAAAFLHECFDFDESFIPLDGQATNDDTDRKYLSEIVRDIERNVQQHNMKLSSKAHHDDFRADPTFSDSKNSSSTPWSSTNSTRALRVRMRNDLDIDDDMTSDTESSTLKLLRGNNLTNDSPEGQRPIPRNRSAQRHAKSPHMEVSKTMTNSPSSYFSCPSRISSEDERILMGRSSSANTGPRRVPKKTNHLDRDDAYDLESLLSVGNNSNHGSTRSSEDMQYGDQNDDISSVDSSINPQSTCSSIPSIIHNIVHKTSGFYGSNKPISHTINQPAKVATLPLAAETPLSSRSRSRSFDISAVSMKVPQSKHSSNPSRRIPRSSISDSESISMDGTSHYQVSVHYPKFDENDHHSESFMGRSNGHTLPQEELSEDSSEFSLNTTMTFESVADGGHFDARNQPIKSQNLVITTKRRDKKNLKESVMKEVLLLSKPGEYITRVLTLSNKGSHVMTLYPVIKQTRFDSLNNHTRKSKLDTSGYGLDLLPELQAFQVSPHKIDVYPGQQGTFYVTFSPSKEYEGIYSGALKINSRKKVSYLIIILL